MDFAYNYYPLKKAPGCHGQIKRLQKCVEQLDRVENVGNNFNCTITKNYYSRTCIIYVTLIGMLIYSAKCR